MIWAMALAVTSVGEMQGERRVLIVAATGEQDSVLGEQRRDLSEWRRGAADRDVSVVEVVGEHVSGSHDSGKALRSRYALRPDRFEVILIGKDGHVALRSLKPLTGTRLEAAIDAMPMRRAGLR